MASRNWKTTFKRLRCCGFYTPLDNAHSLKYIRIYLSTN
jgi:hypothetical protein